jgi:hypothetical protein
MYIQLPVQTEVIEKNADICTNDKVEGKKIVIHAATNVPRRGQGEISILGGFISHASGLDRYDSEHNQFRNASTGSRRAARIAG